MTVVTRLQSGGTFARVIKSLAAGGGRRGKAAEFAREKYPDSPEVERHFSRSAVPAGSTTGDYGEEGWGAGLAGPPGAREFLTLLATRTALGRFGTNGVPALRSVPPNTPVLVQMDAGSGYWVGQGAPKPIARFDFERFSLPNREVATIVPITKELLEASGASSEGAISSAAVGAVARHLDTAFLDPSVAEVPDESPASITWGAPTIPSTGDPAADVAALVEADPEELGLEDAVLLMSPRTAVAIAGMFPTAQLGVRGGVFAGLPVVTGRGMGDNLGLVHAGLITIADPGVVRIDTSENAALIMESESPGGPGEVVSMFQDDCIAFRLVRLINWMRAREDAVRLVTGVDYVSES